MKTEYKSVEEIQAEQKWYVVDATNLVLGRMATQIASILKGKNKPSYAPHQDHGDFVVVINAEKVRLTGNKENTKTYFRHRTTRPGSQVVTTYKQMIELHPERVVEYAVKGMLPKNSLGRKMIKKLHVVAGDVHPHTAQQPEALTLKY
jgi:large subunit ribosomal protein L13